jgi:hypothetical protein
VLVSQRQGICAPKFSYDLRSGRSIDCDAPDERARGGITAEFPAFSRRTLLLGSGALRLVAIGIGK